MAASFLESEGIKTYIKDELTIQIDNFYSNAIGGVKIYVDEIQYNKGIETLKKGGYILESAPKIETIKINASEDRSICPYCKSENIGVKRNPNIFSIILMFMLHVLFPIFKKTYHCFDCEKEWRYKRR